MDRFKFRVWDEDRKEYISQWVAVDTEGELHENSEGGAWSLENLRYPNRYIIEQCTGLKDKKGKLIYEGDIVRFYQPYGDTFDCKVCWRNQELEWNFETIQGGYPNWREFGTKRIEVVGNIHETNHE